VEPLILARSFERLTFLKLKEKGKLLLAYAIVQAASKSLYAHPEVLCSPALSKKI
jgi:hypothetical protein